MDLDSSMGDIDSSSEDKKIVEEMEIEAPKVAEVAEKPEPKPEIEIEAEKPAEAESQNLQFFNNVS